MIIGTAAALLFELFTIFQSVDEITVLKCGAFDAAKSICT